MRFEEPSNHTLSTSTDEVSVHSPPVDSTLEDAFVERHKILDSATPRRLPLTARFKRSFAYRTFRERTPKMLVDLMTLLKDQEPKIVEQYGADARFDLQCGLWRVDILLKELLQNKRFMPLNDKSPEAQVYNELIEKYKSRDKDQWFTADWLFAECYLHRRILDAFRRTKTLQSFDCFRAQKEFAARSVVHLMRNVLEATRQLPRSAEHLQTMLKLSLWCNRCDLSNTRDNKRMTQLLAGLNKHLLVDQSAEVWPLLAEDDRPGIVDIVLDGAGYELFMDLLLGDYLVEAGLATKVRYHVKAVPWFGCTVTAYDFLWMLRFLRRHELPELADFGRKLRFFKCQRCIELVANCPFWTTCHSFWRMRKLAPCLYVQLSFGELVIFKGDLNYRKLVDDFNWEPTTSLAKCLGGFLPSSVCVLRAIKSDVYCGLPICTVEWLSEDNPNWMCHGDKGLIQLVVKQKTRCPETP
ncbi:hypothetical protein KR222_002647, partial [Zaprionus bogoriensis]